MQIFYGTAPKGAGIAILMTAVLCISHCNDVKKSNPLSPTSPTPGNGLTVLTPNLDTTYYIGDTMEITWDLKDTTVTGLQIDFSQNGGHNYFMINTILPGWSQFQDRAVQWVIPDSIGNGSLRCSTISDSCRIFIHDYFNYTIGDVSDKLFSIHKK